MRKISVGNKSKFIVFTIVIIVIIIILISGLNLSLGMKKSTYTIETGSFLYDIEYNPIKLEENATLKEKWNGDYYLTEGKKNEYNVGQQVVVYRQNRSTLELFGVFFELKADGTVIKLYDNNEITDTSNDRFFKIADRKYLIISKNITNPTRTLNTKDYLMVVLDKAGNAQIMNYELNAKMLNQVYIDTPSFQFDVANEKLIFEHNTLDLKKILGSTNEFKEMPRKNNDDNSTNAVNQEVVIEGNNTIEMQNTTQAPEQTNAPTIVNSGNNGGGSTGGGEDTIIQVNTGSNQSGTPVSGGSVVVPTNNGKSSSSSSSSSSENKNKDQVFDKSVTLNKVTSGVSYIDVDYYIVDPQGQYKAVYMLVDGNGVNRTIALDKSNTNYRITGLESNTNYKITIGSKSVNSKGTTVDVIEDVLETRTLKNNSSIKITKVAGGRVYFNLKLDSNFLIDSGSVSIYINNQKTETIPINLQKVYTSGGWNGSFEYENASEIALRVEDVMYNGEESQISLYTKIRL